MTLAIHSSRMGGHQANEEITSRIGTDEEEFECINLQGTFRDMNPCSTISKETIISINMPNERQDYCNMIEFITKETRRDQMIDD